ncbi:MAG: NADH-quinone oxidoreductase subunit NuoE [Alphaproteobacteria bacterium]|nr:MAG: NADH-quinone oxidoreductase subunit NuoE [Alphaproteobacteria bacterium]
MLRRLHHEQPESFAFTEANLEWARRQIAKYPPGRQASAIIPLLWRAQEQEGWLSRPAIEYVADMLGMPYIRALEVATFYFMFQLQPVGSVAHVQVCGTTPCMLCGSEALIEVCREKIAPNPHELSADGKFSWEEVECLGACTNAPMVQIGKDYYEDLTPERFAEILDELAAGRVPVPGPQNGRFAAEPAGGPTTLRDFSTNRPDHNATVALALERGDTVARITGEDDPLLARPAAARAEAAPVPVREAREAREPRTPSSKAAAPAAAPAAGAGEGGRRPPGLPAPEGGKADDLKRIKGIGPALEKMLNELGIWHFHQIAAWTDEEVAWIDNNLLRFKGRATRDEWVKQAKILAEGGETEFSSRVDRGEVY